MRTNESISPVPQLDDEQEAMDEEWTLLRPRPPQVESVLSESEWGGAPPFEPLDPWPTGATRREHERVPDELLPATIPPPSLLPSVIPLTDDDGIEDDGIEDDCIVIDVQVPLSVEPDPFRST